MLAQRFTLFNILMKMEIWLSAAMALRRGEITTQEISFIIPGDLPYVMERLDQLVEWLFFPMNQREDKL
ncbi:MAG: hypothetical protein A3G30_03005 [Chlamydiae bacterium RIFCSPLOWO2_12_FULL_49_12]|nr:MAG: hypothetical protein A3D18_00815 [Chlamydiae bacterium RIFCSPHIGHO2_02_FULL_49_29]OGN71307.1 MAG: hypothetical protein A3I15_00860 [Chlamydiae bacterium RIFCSPLOWO2_02_FULL_49_12]OGN74139.1 MAG: hypothetical protein A3G30_03005 [Chlamydiae bacterium RIFCSPLOWO2_12_FULL_49_12]